jgi:deoxyribose-phosphate aldolase
VSAQLDAASFARLVDHTLLKPDATAAQIDSLCREAREAGCAAVCVNGMWLRRVVERLAGSPVAACMVAGFPLGAMEPGALSAEIQLGVEQGASEVDIVIPVGLLRQAEAGEVEAGEADPTDELAAILTGARQAAGAATLKLILETATLDGPAIDLGCRMAVEHGFDFVKTSTGFSPAGGATIDAVRRMRQVVGEELGVKASGGIRTLADVEAMVAAGATRLGMSATLDVLAELEQR